MKRLWAPWRLDYILSDKSGPCVFCLARDGSGDEKNYVLYRGESCYVIMNIFPYNNGHLMVIPYEHVEDMSALDDETLAEMMVLTRESCRIIKKAMNSHGFNTGINIGEAAGAGIKEHLHMHIVPRWENDTNFMAVLDDTRVLPQHLRETFEILRPGFERLSGKAKK